MLRIETKLKFDKSLIEAGNLTSLFPEDDLKRIGEWCWSGFVKDKQSRASWEKRMNAAMDLAMQIQQAKNFPWQNCSNIVFPLVSIAALQFSTRSYPALIHGTQVVRYRVVGQDPHGLLRRKADMLGRHMSWQVLEQDESWEEQHQRMLINLAIVGTNFIKTRYSPVEGHNTSCLVQAKDLVVDYFAKSIESARRKTEIVKIYRNEIWEKVHRKDTQGNSIYRNVLEESWYQASARTDAVEAVNDAEHNKRIGISPPEGDEDTPFIGLEQHCWLDLDGDGYAEPYVVLLESSSHAVLRIVSRVDRWEDVDTDTAGTILSIKPVEYYTKFGFIPAPDGGLYDMGFGVLLGPLNETVNTAINQMFDAGTANMLGGGFVTTGAKMKAGVYTRTPGEWKILKGVGDDIKKSLVTFPEIPIPAVMMQLLQFVVQYADRLAGTVETTVGENPGQNTPAQTYQGLLENGLQIYKSLFKSIWRSMKMEFQKLHQLNARFMPDQEEFGEGGETVSRELYLSDPKLLAPVADPNLVTDSQRIHRAVLVRQSAMQVPGYNLDEVERDWLKTIGCDNIERIFPGPYSEWYKKHPLPNPRLQVEQAKIQGISLKAKGELQKAVLDIQSRRQEVEAHVALMRAQAAKLVADIGADRAAAQLEQFDVLMTHLSQMAEVMNQRAQALSSMSQEVDSGDQAGRGGRLENASSNQRALPPPEGAPSGGAGAVGNGGAEQQ